MQNYFVVVIVGQITPKLFIFVAAVEQLYMRDNYSLQKRIHKMKKNEINGYLFFFTKKFCILWKCWEDINQIINNETMKFFIMQ